MDAVTQRVTHPIRVAMFGLRCSFLQIPTGLVRGGGRGAHPTTGRLAHLRRLDSGAALLVKTGHDLQEHECSRENVTTVARYDLQE